MAEQKICSNKGCSNKFTAKSNKKIYCSDKCNRKAYYKRKITKHPRIMLRDSFATETRKPPNF